MTFREFLAARRSRRLANKAHRAMFRVYGSAWTFNAGGIVGLLTAPGTLVAVDVTALEQTIRTAVAQATAAVEPTPIEPTIEDEASYVQPVAVWEEPAPAVPEEQPSSIFAERQMPNGAAQPTPPAQPVQPARVQPATSADEKRREFVRNFLRDERAARGLIPN